MEEWIVLEKLARPDVPMVMLNGGLDKVWGKRVKATYGTYNPVASSIDA